MNSRTCAAVGCRKRVGPHMMFCRPHWFALPARLQSAVRDSYDPRAKRQGVPYLRAAAESIRALSQAKV